MASRCWTRPACVAAERGHEGPLQLHRLPCLPPKGATRCRGARQVRTRRLPALEGTSRGPLQVALAVGPRTSASRDRTPKESRLEILSLSVSTFPVLPISLAMALRPIFRSRNPAELLHQPQLVGLVPVLYDPSALDPPNRHPDHPDLFARSRNAEQVSFVRPVRGNPSRNPVPLRNEVFDHVIARGTVDEHFERLFPSLP